MPAFTTASLPTGIYSINTVEELVTWGLGVLQFNNSTDQYTEAANTNKLFRFIQPQIRIPSGELIVVNRGVIEINEAASQILPAWKRVKEFGSTTIPAGFQITG